MDLQLKLADLAAALRADREKHLTDWLGTLRIGFEKPGAALSDTELRDHFSDLLEDLCHQLEVPLTETSEISALKHAEVHGDIRWAQGYKLPELIREVAALRTVVIAAVVAHGHSRLSLHEQSLANIIVHRFFDAVVVESATFFASLSQDAAVLQERQLLAQELHDSACQTIQAAFLNLAVLRRRVDPATGHELNVIATTLKQGLDDVRTIVHGLVPTIRKFEEGLPAALRELALELARLVPCEVRCDPVEIPTKQSFQLFRIAQEAAGNACKYAGAKTLSIALTEKDGALQLEIHDDGRGFDVAAQNGSGLGLHSMKQRARAIGGHLRLKSRPGAGTTITCILPLASLAVGQAL
jgi:signal transduction histidine kinase